MKLKALQQNLWVVEGSGNSPPHEIALLLVHDRTAFGRIRAAQWCVSQMRYPVRSLWPFLVAVLGALGVLVVTERFPTGTILKITTKTRRTPRTATKKTKA